MNFDYLKPFNKIIVTGPPRSGTTISARIIAHELGYKFIDETWYDGNNAEKFNFFLYLSPRKMVIQMTAFLKDIWKIDTSGIAIVLIKREIKDILASFKHSESFKAKIKENNCKIFSGFDVEAIEMTLKHFGYKDKEACLPQVIYDHFYGHRHKIKNSFEIEYESFSKHKLFIEKAVRRKKFIHIKQINLDPYWVSRQIMVT